MHFAAKQEHVAYESNAVILEQWPLKRLTSVLHQVTTLQIQPRRQTFLYLDLAAHHSARIKILT